MDVVGIDLAGSEKRDTGYCLLDGSSALCFILHSNTQLIKMLKQHRPAIIAIDAPLTLPAGRKSIDQRNSSHFRKCDLELRRLGIPFFPITLGPMRMLTKRGMLLKNRIQKALPRTKIIEVYPGATYDTFRIPRKNRNEILRFFRTAGISFRRRIKTQDEFDAVAAAFTARLFSERKARKIGSRKEGTIVIPE